MDIKNLCSLLFVFSLIACGGGSDEGSSEELDFFDIHNGKFFSGIPNVELTNNPDPEAMYTRGIYISGNRRDIGRFGRTVATDSEGRIIYDENDNVTYECGGASWFFGGLGYTFYTDENQLSYNTGETCTNCTMIYSFTSAGNLIIRNSNQTVVEAISNGSVYQRLYAGDFLNDCGNLMVGE